MLVAVPGSVFALLVAGQIYDGVVGCGSVDPTDPSNYTGVTIRNDTADNVLVDKCKGANCGYENLPVLLGPGQTYQDHAFCGMSGHGMTSWEVKTTEGKELGYIAVETLYKYVRRVFNVSHASISRSTPTVAG
jgi:hypothetical protein